MSSNTLGYSTAFTLQGTYPPIFTASFNGRLNVVQVLLDHGADVNQPTDVSNCLHNNSPHCMYKQEGGERSEPPAAPILYKKLRRGHSKGESKSVGH